MKALKIVAIVCSVVFVVCMGMGAAFAAVGFKDGFPEIAEAFRNGEYGDGLRNNGTLTTNADNMENLVIYAGAAEVTLVREERADVKAEYSYWNFGSLTGEPVTLDTDGDTVEINAEINTEAKHYRFFSSWRRLTLTVYIPQAFDGNLTMDIGAGTLTVQGEQQYDEVGITVGAGALSADDLRANSVNADISAGKFTADSLRTQELTLNIGLGDAALKGLTGATNLTVDMGNATLEYVRLGGNVDAQVSMGHASIYLPEETKATLELTADMGSVSQSFGSDFSGESETNHISGKINGGGASVTGSVDMGSLEIVTTTGTDSLDV